MFAGAVAAGLCHAQDTPIIVVPEIVVTATRLPEPQAQAVRPTTVITAEQIAQSGQQTTVEVLQALGGVEIASNGGMGQVSSVFIRGANSTHTLVRNQGQE